MGQVSPKNRISISTHWYAATLRKLPTGVQVQVYVRNYLYGRTYAIRRMSWLAGPRAHAYSLERRKPPMDGAEAHTQDARGRSRQRPGDEGQATTNPGERFPSRSCPHMDCLAPASVVSFASGMIFLPAC
jgi:hypothetical protein